MAIQEIPIGFFAGGAKLAESEGVTLREVLNELIAAINGLLTQLDSDELVKINVADTIAEFLSDKLSAGDGIAFNVLDKGGGNLVIEISAPGSTTDIAVQVTPGDTNPSGLQAKLVDSTGGFLDVQNVGGDEQLVLPATGGWIYITDVSVPGGTASAKVFQDTGNTVLQSFTSSANLIDFDIRSAHPLVNVHGVDAELTRDVSGGFYTGVVQANVTADGDVVARVKTPDDQNGAFDTVAVTLDLPPNITAATFTGGYPGLQSEVKEDDPFQLQVTADKSFDRVVIDDFGAGKSAAIDVTPGVGPTIVTLTVADRGTSPQLLGARVQVRDSVTGALSPAFETDSAGSVDGVNVINLNNLFPTAVWGSPTYPGIQQALKASEQATVPITLANLDTVAFDDNSTGELTITNPTTIEPTKTVTRAGGTYNISADNLRATANRVANDATTVASRVVNIANVAVIITVTTPAARLRSGGNDGTAIQNHVITIIGNQQLLQAPTMDPGAGNAGTFIGPGFVGGPSAWTRTLQVTDNDDKATKSWQNLVATNLAGIITTVVGFNPDYVLGGFVKRNPVWQAFQTTSDPVNVAIADSSKIQGGIWQASGNQSIRVDPPGTTAPPEVAEGYSPSAVATKPHTVEWQDTTRASSNTETALLFDYEEVV